jgi:hypothetical protein
MLYNNETMDGYEIHRVFRYTGIPALKKAAGWEQGTPHHKKVLKYLDG